jgi:hypothetical protein
MSAVWTAGLGHGLVPRLIRQRNPSHFRACLRVPANPKCTRLVPATNSNLATTDNTTCPFAGLCASPLPDSNRRPLLIMEVSRRHARARAITRDTLSPANRALNPCLPCPRVPAACPKLMYPSRTRGVCPFVTSNGNSGIASDLKTVDRPGGSAGAGARELIKCVVDVVPTSTTVSACLLHATRSTRGRTDGLADGAPRIPS